MRTVTDLASRQRRFPPEAAAGRRDALNRLAITESPVRAALRGAARTLRARARRLPSHRSRRSRPLHRNRSGRSEENKSELQSLMRNSYAAFSLTIKNLYTLQGLH